MMGSGRSQFGEDVWIAEHCGLPERGVFVDVGASDGVTGSNSLYFEERGWWCLCIEPDPRHFDQLQGARAVCELSAASTSCGEARFWLHPQRPSRSSLVPSEDVMYEPIVVRTVTLDQLVAKYALRRIDILDIDVEGHELAVWESLDRHTVRPWLVIIEYADTRPRSSFAEIQAAFAEEGYALVHRTPANLIFEHPLERPQ
jgi:FkbM family methyltransferase